MTGGRRNTNGMVSSLVLVGCEAPLRAAVGTSSFIDSTW